MINVNEEVLKKITGDFPDEMKETVYRLFASILIQDLAEPLLQQLATHNEALASLVKIKDLRGALASFALAALFEFIPIEGNGDHLRKRLTYNLRVQSYEELAKFGISLLPTLGPVIPLVNASIDKFQRVANGDLSALLDPQDNEAPKGSDNPPPKTNLEPNTKGKQSSKQKVPINATDSETNLEPNTKGK